MDGRNKKREKLGTPLASTFLNLKQSRYPTFKFRNHHDQLSKHRTITELKQIRIGSHQLKAKENQKDFSFILQFRELSHINTPHTSDVPSLVDNHLFLEDHHLGSVQQLQ